MRVPVNLSIKNAPDDIVAQLRERAIRHRRSLRGELLTILEEAVRAPRGLTSGEVLAEVDALRAILDGTGTPHDAAFGSILAEAERLGLRSSDGSAATVRTDRNAD